MTAPCGRPRSCSRFRRVSTLSPPHARVPAGSCPRTVAGQSRPAATDLATAPPSPDHPGETMAIPPVVSPRPTPCVSVGDTAATPRSRGAARPTPARPDPPRRSSAANGAPRTAPPRRGWSQTEEEPQRREGRRPSLNPPRNQPPRCTGVVVAHAAICLTSATVPRSPGARSGPDPPWWTCSVRRRSPRPVGSKSSPSAPSTDATRCIAGG